MAQAGGDGTQFRINFSRVAEGVMIALLLTVIYCIVGLRDDVKLLLPLGTQVQTLQKVTEDHEKRIIILEYKDAQADHSGARK